MQKRSTPRREFLGALGLGAAAAAIPRPLEPTAAPAQAAPAPHQGYRLSEHVRKYYETTQA